MLILHGFSVRMICSQCRLNMQSYLKVKIIIAAVVDVTV